MLEEYASTALKKAVASFSALPGIGTRTALRFVLHLLKRPPEEIANFANNLLALTSEIHYCKTCHNLAEGELCNICASPKRNHQIVCVVENVQDVLAIERTGQYNGVYHVLGGLISPIEGISPNDLEIDSLIERLRQNPIDELILAIPPTMEGDTTNFYIYKRLNALPPIKITQIARGVAVGNELENTDEITLGRSIIDRVEYRR